MFAKDREENRQARIISNNQTLHFATLCVLLYSRSTRRFQNFRKFETQSQFETSAGRAVISIQFSRAIARTHEEAKLETT